MTYPARAMPADPTRPATDTTPPEGAIPDGGAAKPAFELLHPGVQRQLWRMGWAQLRPLQVESIRLMASTDDPLVLAAATASGKTEAAFLPILSRLADDPVGSVRAVYVGPLKALINDQFARVEELCGYLDVPVFRWHGDVPAAHKERLVKAPGGVLLITPESLESLFVNRSQFLAKLFGGLRFVVIDELHSFLDNERGLHLRSLLSRVARVAEVGGGFRPVALSATIGDFAAAQRFLDPDRPDRVRVVGDASGGKELKYRIYGYRPAARAQVLAPAVGVDGEVGDEDDGDAASDMMHRTAVDIVKHCAGGANLVFANRRGDVEAYADLCGRIAAERHVPDRFLVHHGSLSAEIREDAEQTMKAGAVATTFCSSTLEMGVDIGSVRAVGQVGPPWSVASLKQRLGRSGRRDGEPQIMRVYVQGGDAGPTGDVFDRLNLELLQAVAVTELMLDGWVEPPAPPLFDLSTLTQQVISVIAETGGVGAKALYERLCVRGPFREVEPPVFARLLRCLGERDVVEQMQGGDLILGLTGERLRKDKGFYAAFQTPDEYTVLHGSRVLGTLQSTFEVGEHLLFAGRRWRVTDVDDERLRLQVEPARGWKVPPFRGGGGGVHPRVRQKMREVLSAGATRSGYLDPAAQLLLDEIRQDAAAAGVTARDVLPLGPKKTALMTWTGTTVQETLVAMFATFGIEAEDKQVGLVFKRDKAGVREAVRTCLSTTPVPELVAEQIPRRSLRKYDDLLSDDLLDVSIARGRLDLASALAQLRKIDG